jgi:hypothetical protein
MAPSLVVLLAALSKETMFYTYAHYKPDNSVFYIGKGQRNRAFDKTSRSKKWKAVVAQEGDHKVEILARWPTEQEAFEHEIFLIDCFKQMGASLVNVSKGGYGASGYRHTEEYLEHMKSIMTGSGNAFFGKTHSDATKQKISQAKTANPTRAWLGKFRDEATRSKISASLMGHVGHKHTDETKAKLSLAHTGKKQASPSEETRKKLSESIKASWVLRRQKVRKEV